MPMVMDKICKDTNGLSLAKSQSSKLTVTRKTSEDRADKKIDEAEAEDRNRRTLELTVNNFLKASTLKKGSGKEVKFEKEPLKLTFEFGNISNTSLGMPSTCISLRAITSQKCLVLHPDRTRDQKFRRPALSLARWYRDTAALDKLLTVKEY